MTITKTHNHMKTHLYSCPKTLLLIIVFLLSFTAGFSQATKQSREIQSKAFANRPIHKGNNNNFRVDTLNNIQQSIINVLFGGCVNVSNLTYTGPNLSIGYFVDNSGTLGVDSGIVMTTGSVIGIEDSVGYFACTDNGMPGDALLETLIPGDSTFDASIIEFDFVPLADTIIGCKYVFGSEEYPEYVCSPFNDVFGFFITGPNPNGAAYSNTDLALIPGTNLPVAINTVNNGNSGTYGSNGGCISTSYSSDYIDNEALDGHDWCYDGYTIPFTITTAVFPDSLYHFKIAIADAGDHIFDSGVFLKGGSFLGNTPLPFAKFAYIVNSGTYTVSFTNQSLHSDRFTWDFGDGTFSNDQNPIHTYQSAGIYNAKLTANNVCSSVSTTQQINFYTLGISSSIDQEPILTLTSAGKGLYNLNLNFENTQDFSIKVLNVNGQLVYNNTISKIKSYSGSINLSNFADGIYYMEVLYGNKKMSYKLIN
jgi:PKD repeat protein